MQSALMVQVPRQEAFGRIEFEIDAERPLRAWAQGAALLDAWEEKFNEDFYRNPSTGQWLASSWSQATTGDWGDSAPLLERAGARLLAALNSLILLS